MAEQTRDALREALARAIHREADDGSVWALMPDEHRECWRQSADRVRAQFLAPILSDLTEARALAQRSGEERDRAVAECAKLKAERDAMAIAIEVYIESGHGGAMAVVRGWLRTGRKGPLPFPEGACFREWAKGRGIRKVKGFAARSVIEPTGGGADV